mgnify:CR=1 FL=1
MAVNSKRKGAAGERELAHKLNECGFETRRSVQYNGKADDGKLDILNEAGIDLMLCGHIHKFRYDKPGTTSADFPVICNPNLRLMEASVKADNIRLEFLDEEKVVKTIDIRPGAWR